MHAVRGGLSSQVMALCCLLLLLTGCYHHRAIGFMQDRKDLPHYEQEPYHDYRIAINDEIIYRLITMDETISKAIAASSTNNMNMSYGGKSYRVYEDGTIDIPFLPPVHVEGLTIKEAQDTLQAAFREIIPDAEVKLTLRNKQFYVIGEIGTGTYYIDKDRLTIFQALAMTGDVNQLGDRRHVRIIRPHGEGKPEILEFDIRTNTIIKSKYYYVYPNDVIYVSRARGSFYRVANYASFTGLITSSVSLLITILTYTTIIK